MKTYERSTLYAAGVKVDITPTEEEIKSYRTLGKEQFAGVSQNLYSRILALSAGDRTVLLIGNDLINMPDCDLLKERLCDRFSLNKADLLICGTQNHQSIVTDPPRMDPTQRPELLLHIRDRIHESVIEGVEKAISCLTPARFGYASSESYLNVNKDFKTPLGVILGNNYQGFHDRELFVLRVDSVDGDPIAALINYPVQGCFLSAREDTAISGDFQGAVSEKIERYVGGRFIAPYLIGAAADLVPLFTANFRTIDTEQGHFLIREHTLTPADREAVLDFLSGHQAMEAIGLWEKIETKTESVYFRSGELCAEADARTYPMLLENDSPKLRIKNGRLTHRLHLISLSDELVFLSGNSITSARLGRLVKDSVPCKAVYCSVEGRIIGYVIDTEADENGFGSRYSPLYSAAESERIYIQGAKELFETSK